MPVHDHLVDRANAGVAPSGWHVAGTGREDLWHNVNGTVSIWHNGQIGGALIVANAGGVPGDRHIAQPRNDKTGYARV